MAGNHPGTVTIVVESTSGIVIERNIFSRNLRRTPCFIIFQYNKQEQRVDDILTPCTSSYHEWNKEVCFQYDPTYGDCVWVNMYRDNNRVIGKCDIILSEVPDVNQRPFRRTFMLKKYMPSASNEGDVQGLLKVCVTFNRPAQEAPYPPPYPQQWPRSQPPQQSIYPPGSRQPWQIDQQQPHGPFYTPQDQWQNGPPAPQPMPNPHPGPLYPPNHFHMSDDRAKYQAPHPGARSNFSDIPIAEIYPPPISFTSSWSRHHHHHTATDPLVWSPAEQQENQAPRASASTGTDDDDEEASEMRNFFEAYVPPSLNR